MDSRIYRHVFGNFTESRTVFHHLVPCHNLLSLDAVKSVYSGLDIKHVEDSVAFPFFRPFGYKAEISTVFHPGSGFYDSATELVKNKLAWKEKLIYVRPKNLKGALVYLRKAKSDNVLETNPDVLRYLTHLNKDPAPGFDGDYNWLYNGGNIAGFNINDKHYIIAADEVDSSPVLCIRKFDADFKKFVGKNKIKNKHSLTDAGPVFQICSNQIDDNVLFLVRQGRKIALIKLNNDVEMEEIWCGKIESLGMLTNCDISLDATSIATIDNFFKISIFDSYTGKEFFTQQKKEVSGMWSQIFFNESGKSIYVADHQSLNILDLRIGSTATEFYKPAAVTNECESVCNVIRNESNRNVIQIATSHNLIELDVRNRKHVQRWTHLMKSPPQFGAASYRDNQGIIILQSENPDEVIGIESGSTKVDDCLISKSSPCVLENIKRDLRLAQYQGLCLYPTVYEKLSFAVTGLHMYRDTKDVCHLFTVNGGGDVVVSRLGRKDVDISGSESDCWNHDFAITGLKEFEKHCVCENSKQPIPTEVVDMSFVVKELRNKVQKRNVKMRKRKHPQGRAHWCYSEMFSPESLCYYKDFMAERILHIWGIEMKNVWDEYEKPDEDDVHSEAVVRAKVEDWMKEWVMGQEET